MDYAKLDTATLAHVDDSYYYGAYCRRCKHSARLSLVKLRRTSRGKFPIGEGEGAASMRALRTARGGHHVPGAESANRQCRIPLSRGASGVIHIWSDAPVIPIAVANSAGDAEPMAKRRQPIDDLIDALVWMRRTSKRRARRSADISFDCGPNGTEVPLAETYPNGRGVEADRY
jgi:hypothetical protein